MSHLHGVGRGGEWGWVGVGEMIDGVREGGMMEDDRED